MVPSAQLKPTANGLGKSRKEKTTVATLRSDVVVTAGVQVLRPGQKVSLLGSVK